MADGETAATEYTIGWEPQPGPQTALLACPVFEVFFGGARGGLRTEIIALPPPWRTSRERFGHQIGRELGTTGHFRVRCFQPLSALSMAAKIYLI